MRKKMIALFLCISTVAALSGCGSSKSSTSTGNADSAEKLVKLGDYKNIEVEVDKSYEISDNSVQETIENYFLTAPIYTENKEKDTVADGDVANIDYEGTKDGEAFDGGSAKGYNLKIGSGTFIDGFESGLIGKKVGETVDLNLTFPDSYSNTDLAGKDVVFTVTINGIETKKDIGYEDLTDEYVSENFGTQGITTVDELKSQVSSGLEQQVYSTKMQEVQTEVLAKLLDECEVTIPDGLLDQRIAEYKDRINKIVEDSGKSFEDYTGKTEDEFYKDIDTTMEESLKQELILEAIVRDMKLSISEKSFESFVDQYVSSYKFDSRDAFYEEYGGEDYIKLSYAENQALSKIMDSVKTTVKDTSSSDSSTGADDSSADAE